MYGTHIGSDDITCLVCGETYSMHEVRSLLLVAQSTTPCGHIDVSEFRSRFDCISAWNRGILEYPYRGWMTTENAANALSVLTSAGVTWRDRFRKKPWNEKPAMLFADPEGKDHQIHEISH